MGRHQDASGRFGADVCIVAVEHGKWHEEKEQSGLVHR